MHCSCKAKDGDGHEKSHLFLFITGQEFCEIVTSAYKEGSRFHQGLVTPRDLKQICFVNGNAAGHKNYTSTPRYLKICLQYLCKANPAVLKT